MDLHHDVSPGEVRVAGSQHVTIRVEASLRRRLQYGGVNRAFYVTYQGTLRLEGIEISDRNLTDEWIPLQRGRPSGVSSVGDASGDAIILVTGRQYAAENERNAAVYLTDCKFSRNPFRVLLVAHATAVIVRMVFSDNVGTAYGLPRDLATSRLISGGVGIEIHVKARLIIRDSQFIGNRIVSRPPAVWRDRTEECFTRPCTTECCPRCPRLQGAAIYARTGSSLQVSCTFG